MKIKILIAVTLFTGYTAIAQNPVIKGELSFKEPIEQVYLHWYFNSKNIDSTKLNGKKFVFNWNHLEEPTLAVLKVRFSSHDGKVREDESFMFYLENKNISITAKNSLKDAVVKGSKNTEDFYKLLKAEQPYRAKMSKITPVLKEYKQQKDTVNAERERLKLSAAFDDLEENVYAKFINSNPNSYVSLYALHKIVQRKFNVDVITTLYTALSEELQNSPTGLKYRTRIENYSGIQSGSMAFDFTIPDTEGKPVSLSDFKGKYLLLDFWASWCVPCRTANPFVVKAYNDYKDKNFTVLGVSLDNDDAKQAWLNAIEKDGLTWTQVSELKGWQGTVSKLYKVNALPKNFLIDPSGKIIAQDLGEEKLEQKLAELLN